MTMKTAQRLIIALDYRQPDQARQLAAQLAPLGVCFKIGLQLYLSAGPALVAELASRYRIFLDLKFHDIPNTVIAAVQEAAQLGVWMTNLHAAGGRQMMTAAREAIDKFENRPLLLAVTVLTSITEKDLQETGVCAKATEQAASLSRLAMECGLDGVVCSPREIAAVRQATGNRLLTVVPGIRSSGDSNNDQVRVAAPAEVVHAGGDYLVVGRPVTRAADPLKAAAQIIEEIGGV